MFAAIKLIGWKLITHIASLKDRHYCAIKNSFCPIGFKLDNSNDSQTLKGLLVDPNSAKIRTGCYDSNFSDPIDCVKDTCHLAWLIHDKSKMLRKPILHGAVCSNGTDFQQLSPDGFKHCYVILTTKLFKLFSIHYK